MFNYSVLAASLREAGYDGSFNDSLYQYFATTYGITTGQLNELLYYHLGQLGYTGSLGDRLAAWDGTLFSMSQLFSSGQQGLWYDYSDLTTLFQDSTGTTPVTAAAQPDGLVLDKRKGLVLGPELVPESYSGTATGGFTITPTSIVRDGITAGGSASVTLSSTVVLDSFYKFTFTATGLSGDNTAIRIGSPTAGDAYIIISDGTYTGYLAAGASAAILAIIPYVGTAGAITITNISIELLDGNHATQATAAARPTYQIIPSRVTLDKVDDSLSVTVPTGGFVGTMVLSTTQGTATYGVNIPAGAHTIGGLYFPGPNIVGHLIRHGALSEAEITSASAYMVSKGGGPAGAGAYAGVINFSSYWRGMGKITSFPLINTAAGTNFAYAWELCTSLISFPAINTTAGIDFTEAWYGCSSLISFPLLNTTALTNSYYTWAGCTSLANFPANMFNTCPCTNFTGAFLSCALTQTSVDNILVSINTAGTSNGTLGMTGGTSATPSAAGLVAKAAMEARGWTVTHN